MKNTRGHADSKDRDQLRASAGEHIKNGSAPRASGGALSVDTLAEKS